MSQPIEPFEPFVLSDDAIINTRQALANLIEIRKEIKRLGLTGVDISALLEQNQIAITEAENILRVYDSGNAN